MKVLVLGSGGREHALVWKLKQSESLRQIFCIPGNAGIADSAQTYQIALQDFKKISDFIIEKQINLTIVGPEQPLVEGIVDYLQSLKLAVFGPTKVAAQLEGSKVFAKNFMKKYRIPTARFEKFSEYEKALKFLKKYKDSRVVIKADGLAAGKGSIVCQNIAAAQTAIKEIMYDRIFAEAGDQVVVEEFMEGEEASLFVITDGKDYVVLSPAQDFKRALDGDLGKNTGGMGSYAPTPVLSQKLQDRAIKEVVEPVLAGLQSEGIEYRGVLYCGLMLTLDGPKVVEFNCRFGDPETQVVLPLLQSDLLGICQATSQQTLGNIKLKLAAQRAVCVVAASGGYPDAYEKGKVISGLDQLDPEIMVFHAGTVRQGSQYLTNGGRVLGVAAAAGDLRQALEAVYWNMRRIHFAGIYYRTDIAKRAI
ncbi:MAG: phosphoribosylamine--glycine ligase [Caldithrix sp. RBG_13_44_9]|nr:MAG: phosphoribosylamine--glycine ligase [Caldithrix sp. RBG_13_44_9]